MAKHRLRNTRNPNRISVFTILRKAGEENENYVTIHQRLVDTVAVEQIRRNLRSSRQ